MRKYLGFVAFHAQEHFKNLGFDEDTIKLLIDQGIKDLEVQLNKLEEFCKSPPEDLSLIADTAHTVKGLLANMGLEDEGMRFKKIQLMVLEGEEREKVLGALKELLEGLPSS